MTENTRQPLTPENLGQVTGGSGQDSPSLKELKYGPTSRCPYCKSSDIQRVGQYTFDGDVILEYHCNQCGTDYRYNTSRDKYGESGDDLF